MGRQKGALRRKLNIRWLRWRASRALVSAAPALRRHINFFGAGVGVEDVAERLALRDAFTVEKPLRDDQIDFIRTRCGANDGVFRPHYWEAPWTFVDEHFLLKDAVMLGHTGRLVDKELRGVVTGDGAPENWNRDRATWLSTAPPVEGVALPVRRFTSYFHFFFDVALPLVAYFESGQAPDRPHVLVTIENTRPFVRTTLDAITARYGARTRRLGGHEKARCEAAIVLRRATPCSDWFPARPETAAALKALLLAHLAPPPLGDAAERVYLRRGREKLRNLENADAVDAIAARCGYAAFQPVGENFAEQIQRMDAARRLLAVHGAGLTNLLFARPGLDVVEIFSADFCKSVFLALCQMLGHEHHAVISGAGDYRQNFSADLGALEAALARSWA